MGERYKPLPADFLAELGTCCGSGCARCPFAPRHETGGMEIDKVWLDFSQANPDVSYEEYLVLLEKERETG